MNDSQTVYMFLVQAPTDSYAWPMALSDPMAAENTQYRISTIKAVEFTMDDLLKANAPKDDE